LLEWFVWPIAQENMVRITINWFLAFSSPYINIGAFEWIRLRMIVITVKKSDWASHFQRREKEVISSVGEQFLKRRFEFIVLYDVVHKTWRPLPIGIIVEIALLMYNPFSACDVMENEQYQNMRWTRMSHAVFSYCYVLVYIESCIIFHPTLLNYPKGFYFLLV
jgi:hypothetical protein